MSNKKYKFKRILSALLTVKGLEIDLIYFAEIAFLFCFQFEYVKMLIYVIPNEF